MKVSPLLIAVALREETQGLFEAEGVSVCYTGLGKVNAAHALTRELHGFRAREGRFPSRVVNFGTVGSSRLPTHTLLECRAFVQRDMDVRPLGFPLGHTPFDEHPGMIEAERLLPSLAAGVCGTGDRFETGLIPLAVDCDVVDMEAYALAKVCLREGVPFTAVKYVTDGADPGADKDWMKNVVLAAPRFIEVYRTLSR